MAAQYGERRVRGLLWLLLGVPLATSLGCYSYVPATVDAVHPGNRVKAMLSAEAQHDVLARTGTHYAVVEGKLLEKDGDRILVSVPTVKVMGEYGSQSLYQRIDVSRQGIMRIDVRQLDQFRTFGAIGLVGGVAAVLIARALVEGEPGSPPVNPPPGSDHLRGGLLRITVFSW